MNRAFVEMRADDAFWAADKLRHITDPIVEAAVAAGEFGDATSAAELVLTIRERRDRILQTYLPALNPVGEPALGGDGLRFVNIAVAAGVAQPPGGYRATWSRFDNATGTATTIGETSGATSPLAAPALDGSEFVQVDVVATGSRYPAWERPVRLHFRRQDAGWRLIGLVRQP